jgi:environmental stress-induced protein Ves
MHQHFDLQTLPVSRWKNGAGLTREIVRIPLDTELETFDWRVSIAELSTSSAFSRFDGVDRIITLLDGDGIRMQSADSAVDHHLSTPLNPFAFRGEHTIDATLIGSPSRDFNVMTRRGTTRAELSIVRAQTTLAEAPAGVLYVASGRWRIETHSLDAGSGMWWNEEPLTFTIEPLSNDSALIAVAIRPRAGDAR